jgi:hypothetical protein
VVGNPRDGLDLLVEAQRCEDLLEERDAIAWNLADEQLVQRPDGMWEQPGSTLPLSFSVRATKE